MPKASGANKMADIRVENATREYLLVLAKEKIERLESERDELLAACKMLHKALLYCGSADVRLRLEQEALAKYDIVVYEPRFTK